MAAPVIFWFRQDLRLSAHPALAAASKTGPVIPLYVLDDETPGRWRWGGASRWWLHKSLIALSEKLPLVLRRGRADNVIASLLAETGASAVYFTRGYAPWEGALEQRVRQLAEQAGATCHRYGGFLLHEPEAIRTGQDGPYKVYTPFSRACFVVGEPKLPPDPKKIDVWQGCAPSDRLDEWGLLPDRPNWAAGFEAVWQPGEKGARAALARFLDQGLADYADGRDRPDLPNVSRLSPHLHWGEISPAQVWLAVRNIMASAHGRLDRAGEKFLKELLWREFSYHLLHHWPKLPVEPFRPEFVDFPWIPDKELLRKWQRGETGYPIVDAGMRELWATGFMHNRVRMITASFLIKHLLQDWRQGETWFWDTLVDADIASNAASWQWVAGSGADAAPYFRIFNPVLQGEKFDPHGIYVRRWLPELADLPASLIHKPWQAEVLSSGYQEPLIEHGFARNRALAALQQLKSNATSDADADA
jgi:deoxyribodipyrimidine photo-lyase